VFIWVSGAKWRDDLEIDAVMFGCVVCKGAKEFLTIEQEFFAFVVERGEFDDAGEDFTEHFGAWMGAGEFKGFFMEHLADGLLDAWLPGEVAVAFNIVNGVEDFLGAQGFIDTSAVRAEPTKVGEVGLDAETVWRWGGDFVDNSHARPRRPPQISRRSELLA
jgi:hypothetical protein